MDNNSIPKKKNTEQLLFFLSLGVTTYWVLGRVMDVYRITAIGAIYELLWLPALALLFVLPVISLVNWFRQKFKINSLFLYSFILCGATILWMIRSE